MTTQRIHASELDRLLKLPAGREVDDAVAIYVLGYTVHSGTSPYGGEPDGEPVRWRVWQVWSKAINPKQISTDLTSAWSALETCIGKHWTYRCYRDECTGAGEIACCDITHGDSVYSGEVHDPDECAGGVPMALAISRALLRAANDLAAWKAERGLA